MVDEGGWMRDGDGDEGGGKEGGGEAGWNTGSYHMNTGTHALLHDASLHVHMNVCHSINC